MSEIASLNSLEQVKFLNYIFDIVYFGNKRACAGVWGEIKHLYPSHQYDSDTGVIVDVSNISTFSIWVEGYVVSGNSARASLLASVNATSFSNAVSIFRNGRSGGERLHIDVENLTMWGCRLFDNEIDARRSFG